MSTRFNDVIRFRAPKKTVRKFEKIAEVKGKKPAELGREIFNQFIEAEETKQAAPTAA